MSKVRVVVWIDGVEEGSAECDVSSALAPHVAQAAIVQVEEPDLDLAFENETNALPAVPSDFAVRPLVTDAEKKGAEDLTTCGTCGRSWDDAIPTAYTPAPSARCPFEAWHASEPDVFYEPHEGLLAEGWYCDVDDGIHSNMRKGPFQSRAEAVNVWKSYQDEEA